MGLASKPRSANTYIKPSASHRTLPAVVSLQEWGKASSRGAREIKVTVCTRPPSWHAASICTCQFVSFNPWGPCQLGRFAEPTRVTEQASPDGFAGPKLPSEPSARALTRLTGYAAQQSQGWCVSPKAVQRDVTCSFGDGDGHGDWFVEFPSSRFQSDYGAEGRFAAKDLPDQLAVRGLSLCGEQSWSAACFASPQPVLGLPERTWELALAPGPPVRLCETHTPNAPAPQQCRPCLSPTPTGQPVPPGPPACGVPAGPRGSAWSARPRGTPPAPAARPCCSARRPRARSGGCPA